MKIKTEQSTDYIDININNCNIRIQIVKHKKLFEGTHDCDYVSVKKHCMICRSSIIGHIRCFEDMIFYKNCKDEIITVDEWNRMFLNPICYECDEIIQCKTSDMMKAIIKLMPLSEWQKRALYQHIVLDFDEELEAAMHWIFDILLDYHETNGMWLL